MDGGHLYRLSRCILLAHEDKTFQGAVVASMSIPWGEMKNDDDLGGYHLVWTRDLAQSAAALLATGQIGTPLRALICSRPSSGRTVGSRKTAGSTDMLTGPGYSSMRSPLRSCWRGACNGRASNWASLIPGS